MLKKGFIFVFACFFAQVVSAQNASVIKNITKDALENSELEHLAKGLLDGIGPRLVGSPKMKQAHDWVTARYKTWGIPAENEQYGQWRGWERGIVAITMTAPWTKTMAGTQLAWSPKTPKGGVTAEVVILPFAPDSISFLKMAPQMKGKIVLVSMLQPTGRPDDNWEKYARKEAFEQMKAERAHNEDAWNKRITNTGYNARNIAVAVEKAGAVAVIGSFWSKEYGSNKIFGTSTKKMPVMDLSLEDYGLLYRLVEAGKKPFVNIVAESKETGMQPTYNTIATIKGGTKADEYVILSAHLDSWDGATGATDNGTGVLIAMEAMRLLKKWCPNPTRTILAGHWGGEEQGLNGSRAFVQDHPEMMPKVQAVFNQDGGTGRNNFINGAGFLHGYHFLTKWVKGIPKEADVSIQLAFPGEPSGGGSDQAPFLTKGIPSFYMGTNNWDYTNVTWHTNLDTYDKIVFDDLKRSVIITAIMAYMASEDPEFASREPIQLNDNQKWPEPVPPVRVGGID